MGYGKERGKAEKGEEHGVCGWVGWVGVRVQSIHEWARAATGQHLHRNVSRFRNREVFFKQASAWKSPLHLTFYKKIKWKINELIVNWIIIIFFILCDNMHSPSLAFKLLAQLLDGWRASQRAKGTNSPHSGHFSPKLMESWGFGRRPLQSSPWPQI